MLDDTEESEGHKMMRIQDIVGAWKRKCEQGIGKDIYLRGRAAGKSKIQKSRELFLLFGVRFGVGVRKLLWEDQGRKESGS